MKHVHYPEEFRAFRHSKLLQLLANTASKPQPQLPTACPDNCDNQSSTGDSKVYHCFIFTFEPVAVSLSLNHPENREGNSAKHTVSVGVLIISEEQETIVLLLPWIKTGLQMLLVIFNGTKKCKGHGFKPLKA